MVRPQRCSQAARMTGSRSIQARPSSPPSAIILQAKSSGMTNMLNKLRSCLISPIQPSLAFFAGQWDTNEQGNLHVGEGGARAKEGTRWRKSENHIPPADANQQKKNSSARVQMRGNLVHESCEAFQRQ